MGQSARKWARKLRGSWYRPWYRTERISAHLKEPETAQQSQRALDRTGRGDLITRRSRVRIPPPLYENAILETEATIAAQRMGFDPTLGLMHADKRYRPSLASDLMEPVRPVADEVVFELLEDR